MAHLNKPRPEYGLAFKPARLFPVRSEAVVVQLDAAHMLRRELNTLLVSDVRFEV